MAYKRNKALTPYCFPKQLSDKHGQQDINVLKVRLTQYPRWQTTLLEQKHTLSHHIFTSKHSITINKRAIDRRGRGLPPVECQGIYSPGLFSGPTTSRLTLCPRPILKGKKRPQQQQRNKPIIHYVVTLISNWRIQDNSFNEPVKLSHKLHQILHSFIKRTQLWSNCNKGEIPFINLHLSND